MGMTDKDNVVGSMVAEIELPVDQFEKDIIQTLNKGQAIVNGKSIMFKITGDKTEVEKTIQQIKNLSPEINTKVNVSFDKIDVDKQTKIIEKYFEKTREKIQEQLAKTNKNLTLSKVVKSELGLGNAAKVEAKEVNQVLKNLQNSVKGFKLHTDDNNLLGIEKKAEDLKKIQAILQGLLENPKLNTSGLDVEKQLAKVNTELETFVKTGGKRIFDNIGSWKEQLNDFGQSAVSSKEEVEEIIGALTKAKKVQTEIPSLVDGKQISDIKEISDEYQEVVRTIQRLEQEIDNFKKKTDTRKIELKKSILDLSDRYFDNENDDFEKDGIKLYKAVKEYKSISDDFEKNFNEEQKRNIQDALDSIEGEPELKNLNFQSSIEQLKELNKQLIFAKKKEKELKSSESTEPKEAKPLVSEEEAKTAKDKLNSVTNFYKGSIEEALSEFNNGLTEIENREFNFKKLEENLLSIVQHFQDSLDSVSNQELKEVSTNFNQDNVQSELNETDEILQKIVYHYGLLNENGQKTHQFGDEITAYPLGIRNGNRGWADGTGTYVTDNYSEYKTTKGQDFKQFFAIDISKLKMYEAHIEEEAERFYNFQHKLEQLAISLGSGYKGFDENIVDVDINSLYEEGKNVFANYSEMFDKVFADFESFESFVDEMIELVNKAGITEEGLDSKTAMQRMNFKKEYGVDDIKTRLLKKLGFQGTDLSGTSYGGLQSGSVIFDIETAPIIAKSESLQEVLDTVNSKIEETKKNFQETFSESTDSQQYHSDDIKEQNSIFGNEAINNTKEQLNTIIESFKTDINALFVDFNEKFTQIENREYSFPKLKEELLGIVEQFQISLDSALNHVDVSLFDKKIENNIDEVISNTQKQNQKLKEVSESFNQDKIQSELNETDEILQKIVYHYGSLSNFHGGKKSHQFGDEINTYSLGKKQGKANGTGTYVTDDYSDFTTKIGENFNKFFAIDISKLKTYETHIEEEAEKFYEFQHKLEQFAIQLGSDYKGFDENLTDVNINSLYEEGKNVFANYSEMFDGVFKDIDAFDSFIKDMAKLVGKFGITENGLDNENVIQKANFKKSYGVDDIKTRFLKKMGFQGVDLSGTSYGKNSSVIFDIDTNSITAKGKALQEVLEAIGVKAEETKVKVQETFDGQKEVQTEQSKTLELNTNIEQVRVDIEKALQLPFNVTVNPNTDIFISAIEDSLSNKSFEINIKGLSEIDSLANTKESAKEQDSFNELNNIVSKVTNSIREKTEAVILEEKTVTTSVGKEVSAFNHLNEKLIEIKNNLKEISGIKVPNIKVTNIKEQKDASIEQATYEELKRTEEEYKNIIGVIQKYKGAIGEIATIYKNTKQDAEEFYKITDINGNSVNLDKKGNLLSSKVKTYENPILQEQKDINKELTNAIQDYSKVYKRIANEDYFENDIELLTKLEDKISDLQKSPILDSSQIKESERALEKLYNEIDVIEKKKEKAEKKREKAETNDSNVNNQKIWKKFEKEQQDFLTKQWESESLKNQKDTYKELTNAIQDYSKVYKRIASESSVEGDIELLTKLEDKISDLQKSPILDSSQIKESERALEKLYNEIDVIEKKKEKQQKLLQKQEQGTDLEEAIKINDALNETSEILKNVFNTNGVNTEKLDEEFLQLKNEVEQLNKELTSGSIELQEYKKAVNDAFSKQQETTSFKNQLDIFASDFTRYVKTNKNFQLTSEDLINATEFNEAKNKIEQIYEIIQTKSVNTKEEFAKLKTSLYENKALLDIYSVSDNLRENKTGKFIDVELVSSSLKSYKEQLEDVAKNKLDGTIISKKYNEALNELSVTVKVGNDTFQDYLISIDETNNGFRALAENTEQDTSIIESVFSNLKGKIADVFTYIGSFGLVNKVIDSLEDGIDIIKEMDTALVELAKTSSATTEQLKSFEQESFNIARRVGSTAVDVTNAAAVWARLGESIENAQILAEKTVLLNNVSEFDDIEDTSSALVSIMQGFKLEAQEIGDVIDKLNYLGNTTSSSTEELATGLQNSAAALQVNGNTLEQTMALLVAANSQVQDASKSGNGLRTIALRLSGSSYEEITSQLSEMGEETDSVIKTTAKLEDEVKALTAVAGKEGISLLDDNGNFRSTYEILLDIAEIWEEIGEQDKLDGQNRQQTLLTDLAGKNRSNILASILSSPELLKESYENVLSEAEGSAEKENQRYLDSIQGHLDQLQNTWQEVWDTAGLQEVIKFFIDLGNIALTVVKNVGLIPSIILGMGIEKIFKEFSILPKTIGMITQAIELLKTDGLDAQKVMKKLFDLFASDTIKSFKENVEEGAESVRELASSERAETLTHEASTQATEEDIRATETETVTDAQAAVANEVEATTETQQAVAERANTEATEEGNIVAEQEIAADTQRTIANTSESVSELASASEEVTTGMLGSVTAFGSVSTAVTILGGVLVAAGVAYLAYSNSLTKAKKDLEKATDDFEEAQQKADSLNSELESQTELLEELKSKGSLTYIEKEQLQDLQSATAELKEQLRIEEQTAKRKALEVAEAQKKVINKEFGDLSNIEQQVKESDKGHDDSNFNIASKDTDLVGLLTEYEKTAKGLERVKNGVEDVIPEVSSLEEATKTLEDFQEPIVETLWENLDKLQEYKSTLKETIDTFNMDDLTDEEQSYINEYESISEAIIAVRKRIDSAQYNTDLYDSLFAGWNEEKVQSINKELTGLLKFGGLNENSIKQIDGITESIESLDFALEDGKTKVEMFIEQFKATSNLGQAIGVLQNAGLGEELSRQIAGELNENQLKSLISGNFNEALKESFANINLESGKTLISIHNLISAYEEVQKELGGNPNLAANPYFEQISLLAEATGTNIENVQKVFSQSKEEIRENTALVEQYYTALETDKPASDALWESIEQGAKKAGISTEEYLSIYSSEVMKNAVTSLDTIKSKINEIIGLTESGKTQTTVSDLLGMSVGEDSTFSDKIDESQSKIDSLRETYNKLKTSTDGLTSSEKIDLIQEFPDLTPYINNSDELMRKIKEINQQTVQELIDEFENLEGATEEDIEALEILKGELQGLNYTNPLDFSGTAEQLSSITSELSSLGSAMQTLEEGTALTKGQMVELAMEYPKLIEQENLFTDTTVNGQQEMLQSIVDMNEQKYDAIIDEKIAELEAGKEVISEQISIEEQKLNILQDLYTAYKNGELQTEEDFNEYLDQLRDLEGQHFVEYKNGELEVTQDALENQLTMENEFGEKSEDIWQEQEMTITGAFSNAASNVLTSFNKIGAGLGSLATQAKTILAGIGNAIKAAFDPNQTVSEAWKSTWSGIDTSGGGASSAKTSYTSQDVKIGEKSVKKFVVDYTGTIKNRLSELKDLSKKYDIEIENLKALKGLDLGDILKTSGSSGSGSGSGSGSDKNSDKESEFSEQIDWAANSVENLTRQIERLQKVLDNTTSAKKQKSILKEMIVLQKKMIKANQASAQTYETVYKLALQDIPKKYRAKYKKLIESDSTFKYQTFEGKSEGKQEELYNAVIAAQEMYKTWQDAKDSTTEAKEQLKEYAEELASVPWEAAQTKIEKLNAKLEVLDLKLANAKNYKEKNKILEKQLKIQQKIVTAQKQAVVENEKDLATAQKALKKNYDSQEKAILKSINRKYKQKSDYKSDGTLKVDKKASASQKKLIKQYNALVKKENKVLDGKKLSTSGITDVTTLSLIEKYNALIDETAENTQELTKAQEEYKATLRETIKSEFDNIQSDYDRVTNIIDKKKQAVQDIMDLASVQGKGMSTEYYEKQIALNNQAIKKNNAERKKLIAKLKEAEIGTDEWYEMRAALFDLDSETTQLTADIQELENTIEELNWSNFDELLNMITDVADEASFLNDLLSSEQLFGDKGEITSAGLASMGLSAQNYDLYMAQSEKIAQQIKELDSEYANDKYNTRYLERRKELVQAQQDAIKSAQSEKEAIIDLVEEGLNAELDALKELVDEKKKALEVEKETYEWQKKIKEQTKDITDLERQIAALENDDSEENRKKLRELKAELADAKETLEESLYDKSIDDQEDALDQLVENSEKANEEYLKNSEQVFADALVKINTNSQVIGNQIEEIARKVGYDVSEYISNAWTNSTIAVSNYNEQFTVASASVISQIGQIANAWAEAQAAYSAYAQESLSASSTAQSAYSSSVGLTTSQVENKALVDWVKLYLERNAIPSTKNDSNYQDSYGALNEYLYENNKKNVLKLADEQYLAEQLSIDTNTSGWRKKVVNWLKSNSVFATGGIIDAKTVQSTGEDGIALVRHKEAILTVDQTKMFARFVEGLPMLDKLVDGITNPNISNISNSTNNPTYNITSQINVDGVATNEIVKNMESVATKQAENVIAKINRTSYSKGIRK